MYRFGKGSLKRLEGVHPDLVRVAHHAIGITTVDFCVLEGVRAFYRQKLLFKAGASQTLNSRHIPATPRATPEMGPVSHAIDLGAWVDGMVRWDWPLYYLIADAMSTAAKEERITLTWGGDWSTLKDGPHYELPRWTHPV